MAFNEQQPRVYISKELLLQLAVIAISLILPLFLVTKLEILPFVMIIGIVGLLLVMKQPFIGLLMYLIIFYIRPQEIWFTGAVGIEKTIGLAMLVLTVLKLKMVNNFRFKITNIHIAIFAFVALALVNVATSYWLSHSWEIWVKLIRLVIVFFCIVHLIDTEKQFKVFIMFTILGTLFHASSAVIRYYQGIREVEMGIERAFAMDTSLGDPNSLAATVVYTLPLLFYYISDKTSRITKIFLGMTSLVFLWCIMLTGSRTGMAAVLVFGFMLIWERKNKIRNFILIALFLVLAVAVMPEQYQQRFISIEEVVEDSSDDSGAATSARSRLVFLHYAFQMFLDRPLFGFGMGNFSTAMGTIYGTLWLQAHSLPAQLISEMGLAGIITFFAWVIIMFRHLRRFKRYFKKTGNKFFYNMTLAMHTHIILLFFMGLGGHNLFRYNWYIISAIIVMMMNKQISGYSPKRIEENLEKSNTPQQVIPEITE